MRKSAQHRDRREDRQADDQRLELADGEADAAQHAEDAQADDAEREGRRALGAAAGAVSTAMSRPPEKLCDEHRRGRAAVGSHGGPGQDEAGRREQHGDGQQQFPVRRSLHSQYAFISVPTMRALASEISFTARSVSSTRVCRGATRAARRRRGRRRSARRRTRRRAACR